MDKPEGYGGDIDGTTRPRRRTNNNDKKNSSPKTVNQAFLTVSSARCKKFSASDMFVLSAFIVGLAMMAYAFHELWWPGESLNPILFYYFIGGLFIAVVGGIVGAVGSKHGSSGHDDNYGWGYGYRRRWW